MDENKKESMPAKDKLVLISIITGTFMAALDATIIAVALPTIAAEFAHEGNTGDISWILLGYTLALCCFILLWGKLGSKVGYKKIFLTGVIVFTACSLWIGLGSTFNGMSLETMIVARVLQGLGAGMLMSMSLALVPIYLPKSRGVAVGIITLAASAGTAFGPALGGLLCSFHWSFIFFINIPIGILCVIMTLYSFPKDVEVLKPEQKLDIVGVILMVVMMFSLIYYLNTGSDIGWMSTTGTTLIVLVLVSAGILVWWEQRNTNPLISPRLMSIRDIIGANMVAVLLFAGMAGTYLLLPYFLQYGQGYNTIEMGLILIANSIGMMVVGPTVGKISDRTGINNRMISVGCIVTAIGFFMMTMFTPDTGLWFVLLALFVMGAGVGTALVSSTNLAMGFAKPEESGEISGIINTFRQAGSTAGVAILETIFAAMIVVPAIIIPGDMSWMMSGFKPAFFVACVFALLAFMVSMSLKDKKVRDQEAQ